MDALLDVMPVVKRVIAARVRDPRVVEDLTQETLVRIAGRGDERAPDVLQAYAIATARNVVASHGRAAMRDDRHAHRLVDRTATQSPEDLAVEREDAEAMAVALAQLDEADRQLLLRHELAGVTTKALGEESGTSAGAIAMRLARARGTLRLEFVLASQRIDLPSRRCKAVLLSLSTRDVRRQRHLGASAHVPRCTNCLELAPAVSGGVL